MGEGDYLLGRLSRTPMIKTWAYDHLGLFGRGVPSQKQGASFSSGGPLGYGLGVQFLKSRRHLDLNFLGRKSGILYLPIV